MNPQFFVVARLVVSAVVFAFVARTVIRYFLLMAFNAKIKEIIKEKAKLPFEPIVMDDEDTEGMTEEEKAANNITFVPVTIEDIVAGFGFTFPPPEPGKKDFLINLVSGGVETSHIVIGNIFLTLVVIGIGALICHFAFGISTVMICTAAAWLIFLGILFL